ncbi:hypothetical protein Pyrde_0535 [Pyrodictium delaneyi]|uniref:Hemerythrin-like domain-containing protein n=1 Tax=Pyrodictium delaneyi TaxID=1273541 RepID=A0A0N7JCX2_9CREN|nr:hemerythrin domain-containing protein [Pyrodictium delaneyi]ALL00585.1 hypothetical protein Pyrde_0535 [Pyrodictium delaneyi]OWJ54045.1 hypothetical protein Pdsh_09250 [Pyrodictium delaneyi]
MTRHVVDGLVEDHDHILQALDLFVESVNLLEQGRLSPDVVEGLIDFLSNFADQCHHGKEELVLFPVLEKRGIPLHGGPIGVMVCEHGIGRYLLRNARGVLDRLRRGEHSAIEDLRRYAESYRELLIQHIDKENNVLFPMAKQVIAEGELVEEAEEVEKGHRHEEMLRKLDELRRIIEAARSNG